MATDSLDIVQNTLSSWSYDFFELLPSIFVAGLIIIITYALAHAVSTSAEYTVRRFTPKKSVNRIFTVIVQFVIFSIGFLLSLQVLGLDKAVLSVLTGLGIVGFALGFAFKDIASNLIAGIMLAITTPFKPGDIIQVGEHFGRVKGIDLRTTNIKAFDGRIIQIPNQDLYMKAVMNYTKNGTRRVEINIGVGYDADLELAQRTIEKALTKVDFIDSKKISVYFNQFGPSSVDFTVYFWVPYTDQPVYLGMISDSIIAIKKAMDKAKLTIPYPIQVLQVEKGSL